MLLRRVILLPRQDPESRSAIAALGSGGQSCRAGFDERFLLFINNPGFIFFLPYMVFIIAQDNKLRPSVVLVLFCCTGHPVRTTVDQLSLPHTFGLQSLRHDAILPYRFF